MNWHGIWAIYRYEMNRTRRTLLQSVVSPVVFYLTLLRRIWQRHWQSDRAD